MPPIWILTGAGFALSACASVLATMNSTPEMPACTIRDDGVAAAAANANHLDPRARARLFVKRQPQRSKPSWSAIVSPPFMSVTP